jgi:hypothetical protein
MEYRVEKISESFDRRMFTFASMSEAEQWLRLYPQPMPDTHRLAYHWQPNPNPKAPPVLVVEVEQRPEVEAAAKPAEAPVVGSRYAVLAAMSEADLETILVEMGIGMPLALPGRKPTKAMLASRVYTEEKRRSEKAGEKKPANNAA